MEKGFEAQRGFEQSLTDKGREILASIREGEKLFILVSRPYNGCDEGVSLQLPKKFADAGADSTPSTGSTPSTSSGRASSPQASSPASRKGCQTAYGLPGQAGQASSPQVE